MSEVTTSDTNSLTSIIEKYKYHPSITAIKNHMDKIEKPNFSFNDITKPFVIKEIKNLDPKKTSQSNDIPTKLIKEYSDIFATIIVEDFNKCMYNGTFPKIFKISEVIPVYKKDEPYDKNNYRSISILSNLSTIYARYMHDEINAYFDILSKFQCGFRKGYSAQHCLLYMIEKIRKIRNSKGVLAAVLTDLLKLLTVFFMSYC